MGTVSPPAMASQGGEQQPVLSGRLAALLFLSPGDLLILPTFRSSRDDYLMVVISLKN